MATIQIILDAINNASAAFDSVIRSAEELDAALSQTADRLAQLDADLSALGSVADNAAQNVLQLGQDAAVAAGALDQAGVAAGDLRNAAAGAAAAAAALDSDLNNLAGQAQLLGADFGVAGAEADKLARSLADVALTAGQLDADLAAAASGADLFANRVTDAANAAVRATSSFDAAQRAASDMAAALTINAGAALLAASRLNDLATAAARASAVLGATRAATIAGTAAWLGWGGAVRALQQPVQLWGGLLDGLLPKFLTQVQAWHLWGDAIIEVISVWSGAAIAIGAWGAAASDAIQTVQKHFTDLHTVADAMNQAIPPMTNNLEKMHQAVQPQVYQLLGDALTVLKAKGGELNTVILQTGKVLEDLGARAALALQSSQASVFLKNAVTDTRLLGTAFGNLFGILGNLIRMNQGWATALLQVGTSILGLIEHVTALIIPLGQLLVLGHGFVLWVGLAVTAVLKFGTMIAGWGAAIAGAVTDFVGLISAIRDFIAVYGLMEALSLVNPLAWVALAVGAITALVVILGQSKSAVQEWGDSVVAAAQKASTVTGAIGVLQAGVAQSAVKMAAAQKTAASAVQQTTSSMTEFNTAVR